MGIFMVSVFTDNPQKAIVSHRAMLLTANNEVEAKRKGLEWIKRLKPESKGWSSYEAEAGEVSKEWLLANAENARSLSEISGEEDRHE